MKPEYMNEALMNATIIWLFAIGGLLVIAAGVVVSRIRKGKPSASRTSAGGSFDKESQYHRSIEQNGRDL